MFSLGGKALDEIQNVNKKGAPVWEPFLFVHILKIIERNVEDVGSVVFQSHNELQSTR